MTALLTRRATRAAPAHAAEVTIRRIDEIRHRRAKNWNLPAKGDNIAEWLAYFRVTVTDHQGGEHSFGVSARTALTYLAAQTACLASTGLVLRHPPAEAPGARGRSNWLDAVSLARAAGHTEAHGPDDQVEILDKESDDA